jgi:hypothetical protein
MNNIILRKTIDFIKEDELWYVDLPEFIEMGVGTKGNLLMVAGADTFLEKYSNGKSRLTVTVSNDRFADDNRILANYSVGVNKEMLKEYNHPEVEHGGYYVTLDEEKHLMWLCPTLLYVFETNQYPPTIYFQIH